MTDFKKLTVRVIIFHFFIIFGAGHSIACIGLIEIFGIPYGFRAGSDPLSFSLTQPYESSPGPAAIFALAGQVLLILSVLIKNSRPDSG